MGNIVDIQVTDEKIILNIPHKSIVNEIDNVASFDSKTGKLISAGIAQKVFEENYPWEWKKYKEKVEFHSLFNAESFNPEATAMYLWGWWDEMTRQGVAGNIVLRSQAKLEINIFFESYESIPQEQREEFEYLIFKFLHAKKLTVNGKEKGWSRRNWFPGSLYVGLTYIILVCFLLLSVIPMLIVMSLLQDANIPPLLNLLLYALVFLGSIVVFAYLGNFMASLLWILILKPFFERKILLTTLSYPGSQPRKHKIGRIERLLINWAFPEKDLL